MRGEALAGGEQPEVGFGVLKWRDLREIRWRLVEGRGGTEAVQRGAGSAGVHRVPVVTTAGPCENGTCMDGWSVRAQMHVL